MTMFAFEERANVLLSRKENLKSMRHSHDEGFEEVQALLWPFRGELNTEFLHDGHDRVLSIYDSTGMVALHNLVNFTMGRLFPPDFKWLTFGPPRSFSQELREDLDIRRAYQQSAERMLHELSVSNFYDASVDWVRDIIAIGNVGHTMTEADKRVSKGPGFRGFAFEPIDISRIWWQLDRQDFPIFAAVKYTIHGREALEEFGDPGPVLSQKITGGRGLLERFEFWHFVFPNENNIPGGIRVGSNRTWASFWVEPLSKTIVREGGFNEHPYLIQTLNRVGKEWYGSGLGHLVRPDVAGLNAGRAMVLEAIEADLLPPLLVEHDSVVKYDQSDAATMSVRSQRDGQKPEFLTAGSNIAAADFIFRSDREQVNSIMLGDIIGEPETEPRSAEETVARQARSELRASTMTTVIKKILMKIVNQGVEMMIRRGAMPELQEVMEATGNRSMDIRFVSPFFTEQKATTAQNSLAFNRAVRELAELTPDVMDRMNNDKFVTILGDVFNAPVDMMNSDEVFTTIRIAKARARALQSQIEAAQALGQAPSLVGQPAGLPAEPVAAV